VDVEVPDTAAQQAPMVSPKSLRQELHHRKTQTRAPSHAML